VNNLFILSSYYIKKLSNNINTLRLFCVSIDEIHANKIVVKVTDLFLVIIDYR